MKLAVVFAVAGLVCVSSSRPWLVGVGLAVFVVSCVVALGHLERTSRVSVVPDAAGVRPRPQGCAPVDPTGTSPGRRDWSPRPGDAIRRHWRPVAACAVLAGVLVLIGCQPDDAGTDGVVDDRCGEAGVCEGSYPTTVPEWEAEQQGCDVAEFMRRATAHYRQACLDGRVVVPAGPECPHCDLPKGHDGEHAAW